MDVLRLFEKLRSSTRMSRKKKVPHLSVDLLEIALYWEPSHNSPCPQTKENACNRNILYGIVFEVKKHRESILLGPTDVLNDEPSIREKTFLGSSVFTFPTERLEKSLVELSLGSFRQGVPLINTNLSQEFSLQSGSSSTLGHSALLLTGGVNHAFIQFHEYSAQCFCTYASVDFPLDNEPFFIHD